MAQNQIDLASIFQEVTKSLDENQQTLNHADPYNGDHGSNMVQTFQTITNALQKKKGSSTSTALNYAARQLSQNTASGSGKLYAQNLEQAASRFKGKQMDSKGALELLQTLIGGGQGAQPGSQSTGGAAGQPGGDLLGSLLGGLMGAGQTPAQQSPQSGTDSPLGGLLGSLMGGGQQSSQTGGGDLLSGLLGGLMGGQATTQQPVQSGGGDLLGTLLGGLTSGGGLQSLVQAFLGGSGMGDAAHRTESTQVVVNAFLQALMGSNRRS